MGGNDEGLGDSREMGGCTRPTVEMETEMLMGDGWTIKAVWCHQDNRGRSWGTRVT